MAVISITNDNPIIIYRGTLSSSKPLTTVFKPDVSHMLLKVAGSNPKAQQLVWGEIGKSKSIPPTSSSVLRMNMVENIINSYLQTRLSLKTG